MNQYLSNYLSTHDCVATKDAETLGVSRAMLSYMVKTGELVRLASGVYSLPDVVGDDLWLISSRSPNIIFSHETALVLWQLHNRIPELASITIPQGASVPRSIASRVTTHRIRPQFHELGKTTVRTFLGHEVPCYDRERTICDVIKSYSRMDVESYANALRTYASSGVADTSLLFSYARRLGIEARVHRALEVLL